MDFTEDEYRKACASAWKRLGLKPAKGFEPTLAAQVQGLRNGISPWQRRGVVYWGNVKAELRCTIRPVRFVVGKGLMHKRETLEVVSMIVPVEKRRQGAATRFLLELQACAVATGRVLLVEAVLNPHLFKLLTRLGFVDQDYLAFAGEDFVYGRNFVLPPALVSVGTGAGAAADADTTSP